MRNRHDHVAERDLVGAFAHRGERAEMRGQRDDIEPSVDGDEVPLVAGGEHAGARGRGRPSPLGAEDAGVEIGQRLREAHVVLACGGDRHVEVLGQALAAIDLDLHAADRHLGDVVTCECAEQLAGVERHRLEATCSVARITPARSFEATCSS